MNYFHKMIWEKEIKESIEVLGVDLSNARLKTLAKYINEHLPYVAEIKQEEVSTDRAIPGTRLRHPGKGRIGNRLDVYPKENRGHFPIYIHHSAQTYRTNFEVVQWIVKQIKGGQS